MSNPPTHELPDAESVWQHVRAFAQECRDDERPIYTLQKRIENVIVEVGAQSIVRRSHAGRTNTANIEYGHIESIWNELRDEGHSSTRGSSRVFAHALLAAAMPDCIDVVGNEIHLRDPPRLPPATVDYAERVRRFFFRGRGGEGPLHRSIRLHIHEHPDEALRGLPGGPWTSCHTERVLETQDRIDVVVRDAEGRTILIEVKPWLCSDQEYSRLQLERSKAFAIAPFAQAAKYRTQWHVLYGTPLELLRCVVAAPAIPTNLADAMYRNHRIESVAVTLPTPTTGPG